MDLQRKANMKDHEIQNLISNLRDIAIIYGKTQQLRERISSVILPIAKQLGATGNFPKGKVNKEDQGEIRIALRKEGRKIFIDFGKPVAWVGFESNEAIQLGTKLIKFAEKQ